MMIIQVFQTPSSKTLMYTEIQWVPLKNSELTSQIPFYSSQGFQTKKCDSHIVAGTVTDLDCNYKSKQNTKPTIKELIIKTLSPNSC